MLNEIDSHPDIQLSLRSIVPAENPVSTEILNLQSVQLVIGRFLNWVRFHA